MWKLNLEIITEKLSLYYLTDYFFEKIVKNVWKLSLEIITEELNEAVSRAIETHNI